MAADKKETFNHRGNLVIYFVLSYMVILLLPVLIGGFIYLRSIRVIESEINRADSAILTQVQQSIDSRFRDIKQLTARIALDQRIKGLMYADDNMESMQRFTMYQLINDFSAYALANDFISQFYIYFFNSDKILSSKAAYDPQTYFAQYYKNSVMDYDEWQKLLRTGTLKDRITTVESKNNEGQFVRNIIFVKYITPYVTNASEETLGTIVFHLNERLIGEVLTNLQLKDHGIIAIMNSHNEILYSTHETVLSEAINYKGLSESENTIHTRVGEESVVVSSIQSEIGELRYVSIISANMFMQRATSVRHLALISLLASVILGGLLAFVFSKKNYRPIHRIVRMIGNQYDRGDGENNRKTNEYAFIEESISNMVEENVRYSKIHSLQANTLRDSFLARMIKGRTDGLISIQEACRSYQIRFYADQFALMLFYVEDIRGNSKYTAVTDVNLIHFVIKNVVEEFVRQNNQGYIVEVDQFMVCLINFKHNDSTEQKRELTRVAEWSKQFIEQKFGIILSVSISSVYVSLSELKFAYDEVMESIEYKYILGSDSIIHADDILQRELSLSIYDFSKIKEQQFVNCVKAGDYPGAKAIIKEVVASNSLNRRLPIDIVKCNMFALINTVLSVINGLGVTLQMDFLDQLNPIRRLIETRTLPQLEREIYGIMDEIESYVHNRKSIDSGKLIHDIMEFTHGNFHNPDLSVTMIADRFGVNVPYLSSFFKSQTGEGLLEYIQKLRVDKAKAIMSNSEIAIKEVSMMVGYANPDTFIRLFKKYEGVTPGKYKGEIPKNYQDRAK